MYRKSFNFHKLQYIHVQHAVLYFAFLSPMQCPSLSLHRSLWWQCHLPQVVLWGSRDPAVRRYPGGGGGDPLPGRLGSCDPLPPDPHQQLIHHNRCLCLYVCDQLQEKRPIGIFQKIEFFLTWIDSFTLHVCYVCWIQRCKFHEKNALRTLLFVGTKFSEISDFPTFR